MKLEFVTMGPANGAMYMVFKAAALSDLHGRDEMLLALERVADCGSWDRTSEPLSSTRAVAIFKYKNETIKVRFNEDRMALFPAGEYAFDARSLIESLPGNEPEPVEMITPREYFKLECFVDRNRGLIRQGSDRAYFEAMTRARNCWKTFGTGGSNGDFHRWLESEIPLALIEERQ